MIEAELEATLARPRYGRHAKAPSGEQIFLLTKVQEFPLFDRVVGGTKGNRALSAHVHFGVMRRSLR
jgi:hypothetical protein